MVWLRAIPRLFDHTFFTSCIRDRESEGNHNYIRHTFCMSLSLCMHSGPCVFPQYSSCAEWNLWTSTSGSKSTIVTELDQQNDVGERKVFTRPISNLKLKIELNWLYFHDSRKPDLLYTGFACTCY